MNRICSLQKKIEEDSNFSKEEISEILNIIKKEISFLIRNNIAITPKNFEKWFYVFCNIIEHNKELNDLDILGLYKEIYHRKALKNKKEKESPFTKKLSFISLEIEEKLSEVVDIIEGHNHNINKHQEQIKKEQQTIDIPDIKETLLLILHELEELKSENASLSQQLSTYAQEIQNLQNQLITTKTEAELDYLTGLLNRRRFERALSDLLKDFHTRNYPSSLIILDIDNFKKINDTYGHPIGDQILKEIALILKTFLRGNNIPARVGGEEFAILVPGATTQEAKNVAERIRKIVETRTFTIPQGELKVTASFGVTSTKKNDTNQSIYTRADEALYKAKQKGKNQVVVTK